MIKITSGGGSQEVDQPALSGRWWWLWPPISITEMTSLFPFRTFMIEFSEVVLGGMLSLPSPQIDVILIKSSFPLYQLFFFLEYWLFWAPRPGSVTLFFVPTLDFKHLCLWGSHGIIFRFTHLLWTFLFLCSVCGSCVLRNSVMSDSLQPHGCSSPGSSAHGILRARILEWAVFFLQVIFLTLGSNQHLLYLLHWWEDSSPLSHMGIHTCSSASIISKINV